MPRTAAKPESPNFTVEDAYKTWRVVASNSQYAGTTEGINFSNGQAVIPALPKTVRCNGSCADDGELCRLHARIFHLNNLNNYPHYDRVEDAQTKRRKLVKGQGYRILSEEQFEEEFGNYEEESDLLSLDL